MGNKQNFFAAHYNRLKPAQKIAISFLLVILIGSLLLCLPVSNRNGSWLNPLDALFTATSATCVTGLVVRVTAEQFNVFGQIVILGLIQIGGLGLMTLVATFLIMLKNRLSVNNRIAMLEMLNQASISDFKRFLTGIIKYTVFFESLGAILLMFVFIPQFGILEGIWKSFFISISAFCNAGFDIIGSVSLRDYVTNPIVNFTVMGLIICGGLGFAVWFDLRAKTRNKLKEKWKVKRIAHSLQLHTKFVIISTLVMVLFPAFLILMIEFDNPETLGNLNIFEKIMASLFESVTFRTAGFETIYSGATATATKFLGMICMFIGGSPGGTSGGIKTTTLAVVLTCVWCRMKGLTHTDVFGRHISREIIVRATMIIVVNTMVLFTGIFLLSIFEPFEFSSICYEATSALATVGLTTGITTQLSIAGKIIIIILMYVGRIGIMTALMSITPDPRQAHYRSQLDLPEGHIIVG